MGCFDFYLFIIIIIIIIVIIHTKILGTCTNKTLQFFCVLEKLTVQAKQFTANSKTVHSNSAALILENNL